MLGAKHGESPGVQAEQATAGRFKAQPARGENPQHVTVRDQHDVAVRQQRAGASKHPVGALADCLVSLTGMIRIAWYDTVAP